MAKAARGADSVISLKVTLRDVRPPIWRRLLVPARMTLGDLHHAIQGAMGWEDATCTSSTSPAGSTAIRARSMVRPTRHG